MSFKHWHLFDEAQVVSIEVEAWREKNVPKSEGLAGAQRDGVDWVGHVEQVTVWMGATVTMTIVPSVEGDVVFGHREQEVLVGVCPYLVVTTGKQQDLKQIHLTITIVTATVVCHY